MEIKHAYFARVDHCPNGLYTGAIEVLLILAVLDELMVCYVSLEHGTRHKMVVLPVHFIVLLAAGCVWNGQRWNVSAG